MLFPNKSLRNTFVLVLINLSLLCKTENKPSFVKKESRNHRWFYYLKDSLWHGVSGNVWADSWGSLSIMRQGLPKPHSGQVLQMAVANCSWVVT